jgi:shikimate dehydrogenase
MILHCVVAGSPIAHSRSPLIHGHWIAELGLDARYGRREVTPETLPALIADLREGRLTGANLTVPLKQAALPLLDGLTEGARVIGAVNTVFVADGRVLGDNTDATGFMGHLDQTCPGWRDATRSVLVLGAGGAALAAVHGLLAAGVERIAIANRSPARAEALCAAQADARLSAVEWGPSLAEVARAADLVVNTTSLGMKGQPPLPPELLGFRPGAIAYDVVYAPLRTAFLAAAEQAGARAVDGLGMLLHQAVPAFERWFGVRPTVTPALRALIVRDLEG